MTNDDLENWLSEDIEISKQRLGPTVSGDPEMVMRWQHERFRESMLPAEFWNLNLDDNWISKQDVRGNDLTAQQSRKKAAAANFVRRYIKVLPYLCRGKCLRLRSLDHQRIRQFQSLVIMGAMESGKSFLAAEIAKAAILRGEDAKWYEYCELVNLMSNKSFTAEEEQAGILATFKTVSLLVIDAFDSDVAMDEHTKLGMKTLVRARRGSGLPYVVTCKPDALRVDGHPMEELLSSQYVMHFVLPASSLS